MAVVYSGWSTHVNLIEKSDLKTYYYIKYYLDNIYSYINSTYSLNTVKISLSNLK